MTNKRVPINRETRRQIKPEAVEIFRRACELDPIYHGCIRGNGCRSTKLYEHCADCREHISLSQELSRMLKLYPWQSPICFAYEAPAKLSKAKLETWWREALEESVADALKDG